MALYANITNPLRASNRNDLSKKLQELSPKYAELLQQHKDIDAEYSQKSEDANKAFMDYARKWREDHPDAPRKSIYDDPEFQKIMDDEERIANEWTEKVDELAAAAKEEINKALKDNGYDGVILSYDEGSFGRSTDAFIALDPNQVKNIDNVNPTENKDIRYAKDISAAIAERKATLKDSNGRTLSKQQQEYFKESKIRDSSGNLLVMYHGTDASFTVFDPRKFGGKVGTGEGYGIYLTDNKETAQSYGRVMEGYANIKRPASKFQKTIKRAELEKLIKATCESSAKKW